jgi:DNA-binding NarL/FixJ family response regulator
MKQATILLADDHSLVLAGIRKLLESAFIVVGAVDNGKLLVEEALRLQPDLVVLDVSMPILNGIDAGREIKRTLPDTKLVFLSMHSTAIYVRKAMEAGASAYVLKSGAAEELLKAIEVVGRGGTYFSPGFGVEVIESFKSRPQESIHHIVELTPRQRQILQLVAEGKQNKEIAALIFVSVKTVEFHRSRLMTILGVRSVAELTRFAIQDGLVGASE